MDPIKKTWLFYSWLEKKNEQAELTKNAAYLIGSFINPEAVKKILESENPTYSVSDEEFDKASDILLRNPEIFDALSEEQPKKKKKRKIKV